MRRHSTGAPTGLEPPKLEGRDLASAASHELEIASEQLQRNDAPDAQLHQPHLTKRKFKSEGDKARFKPPDVDQDGPHPAVVKLRGPRGARERSGAGQRWARWRRQASRYGASAVRMGCEASSRLESKLPTLRRGRT